MTPATRAFGAPQLATKLGLRSTEVWAHFADKGLLGAFISVTQSMHAGLTAMNMEMVGMDDTQAFRYHHLPVITLHSLTQDTLRILHSPRDNLSAIHLDDLNESYCIITEYLAFLDEFLA